MPACVICHDDVPASIPVMDLYEGCRCGLSYHPSCWNKFRSQTAYQSQCMLCTQKPRDGPSAPRAPRLSCVFIRGLACALIRHDLFTLDNHYGRVLLLGYRLVTYMWGLCLLSAVLSVVGWITASMWVTVPVMLVASAVIITALERRVTFCRYCQLYHPNVLHMTMGLLYLLHIVVAMCLYHTFLNGTGNWNYRQRAAMSDLERAYSHPIMILWNMFCGNLGRQPDAEGAAGDVANLMGLGNHQNEGEGLNIRLHFRLQQEEGVDDDDGLDDDNVAFAAFLRDEQNGFILGEDLVEHLRG